MFSANGDAPATAGNPPVIGVGRRMMWYPDKAAFRAGYVSGTLWDKDSIGRYSFAAGINTKAVGIGSTALGYLTNATGYYATSLGVGSQALGYAAIAAGENSSAAGNYSIAAGQQSIANGLASTAMGYQSTAGGYASTAMGYQSTAGGDYSFAMGQKSFANTNVATAIGYIDTATGHTSLAVGGGIYARSWGEVAVGTYNLDYNAAGITSINSADHVFVVGNGTSPGNRSNAMTVMKNGNVGIGMVIPTQKLDVAGTVNATSFKGDGGMLINVVNTTAAQTIACSTIVPKLTVIVPKESVLFFCCTQF